MVDYTNAPRNDYFCLDARSFYESPWCSKHITNQQLSCLMETIRQTQATRGDTRPITFLILDDTQCKSRSCLALISTSIFRTKGSNNFGRFSFWRIRFSHLNMRKGDVIRRRLRWEMCGASHPKGLPRTTHSVCL